MNVIKPDKLDEYFFKWAPPDPEDDGISSKLFSAAYDDDAQAKMTDEEYQQWCRSIAWGSLIIKYPDGHNEKANSYDAIREYRAGGVELWAPKNEKGDPCCYWSTIPADAWVDPPERTATDLDHFLIEANLAAHETEIKKLTARLDKLEAAGMFLRGLGESYIIHRNHHEEDDAAIDDTLAAHDKAIERLTERVDKLEKKAGRQ